MTEQEMRALAEKLATSSDGLDLDTELSATILAAFKRVADARDAEIERLRGEVSKREGEIACRNEMRGEIIGLRKALATETENANALAHERDRLKADAERVAAKSFNAGVEATEATIKHFESELSDVFSDIKSDVRILKKPVPR